MIVRKLHVEQFRGLSKAIIEFEPGFNLLVGENGVGKSSILDCLRIIISQINKRLPFETANAIKFNMDDVQFGWPYLFAELDFSLIYGKQQQNHKAIIRKFKEKFSSGTVGSPREQSISTPDEFEINPNLSLTKEFSKHISIPLTIYYSAHRSVLSNLGSKKGRSEPGLRSVFANALDERGFSINFEAALWRKEAVLGKINGKKQKVNKIIEDSMKVFLDGFENLVVEEVDDHPIFFVTKDKTKLRLEQLSDGERGILAIVMDCARRITLANPDLSDPIREGQALILIDELDLHLHPIWQRTVVNKLESTFPNCQFIATTHSPQIVGEVSAQKVILMDKDKGVYRPNQSLGMDSNWILRHIMGSSDRNKEIADILEEVETLIEKEKYNKASILITQIRELYGEFPDLAFLQTKLNKLNYFPYEKNTKKKFTKRAR